MVLNLYEFLNTIGKDNYITIYSLNTKLYIEKNKPEKIMERIKNKESEVNVVCITYDKEEIKIYIKEKINKEWN